MLKKFLFAVAPMMLVASSVMADDNALLAKVASMDLNGAQNAAADFQQADDNLGQADVDALLGDDDASGEDAIAACFRRIGFGYGYRRYCGYRSYYGYGYGYGYGCYRPYRSCYSPCYSYYRPVCYTPIYNSYWGCW